MKVDEVAERILTLGTTPFHTFQDYEKMSVVKPVSNVSNGRDSVGHVLDAFGKILVLEREILVLTSETGDEGTNALMSDYIREKEKLVWMYSAYLG